MRDLGHRVHFCWADGGQAGQGNQEGRGVHQEARAEAHRGHEDATGDRTNALGDDVRRQGQADGFREEILTYELAQDALSGWLIDESGEAEQECE